MSIIKKACITNAKVKCMVWGAAGTEKSRFALSFPKPLVIDLERGTEWYSDQFNFYKAEIDQSDEKAKNASVLTKTVVDELLTGKFTNKIETLIIDPITDLLDNVESILANSYESTIKKKITDLNALEKSKWYAHRRDRSRDVLNTIIQLPLNIVFVAREKNLWDSVKGQMQPVGKVFDGLELIEYLPDLVIHLEKKRMNITKSRIGKLPEFIEEKTFSAMQKALFKKYEPEKVIKAI